MICLLLKCLAVLPTNPTPETSISLNHVEDYFQGKDLCGEWRVSWSQSNGHSLWGPTASRPLLGSGLPCTLWVLLAQLLTCYPHRAFFLFLKVAQSPEDWARGFNWIQYVKSTEYSLSESSKCSHLTIFYFNSGLILSPSFVLLQESSHFLSPGRVSS